MTRRRKKKSTGDDVSLFPFLAVLICTMGSLIVLLVVLVQQARLHAQEEVGEHDADHELRVAQLAEEKRMEEERLEKLEPVREQALKDLDKRRLELSHLEDHIRRLEARWKQLKALARESNQLADRDESDHELANEQLALIREEIAANRRLIATLEKKLASRRRSFAIIPYNGVNGTRRRPIFVECKGEEMILQPEGVTLKLADFEGPVGFGPGNVLAAALRTIREHYAETSNAEPYPLLVVRPSGVMAYGAARQAMTSWQDEFGYELIGADKPLKYPPPDALLKSQIQESVKRARNRQQLLADAMPGGFSGRQARYIVKRRGGLQRVDGQSVSSRRQSSGMENTRQDRQDEDPGQPTGAAEKPKDPAGANGSSGQASIANQGGKNWGVPNANPNTQGFTRPVRVVCMADAILIMPPRGQYFAPISTPLSGPMSKDDSLRFVGKLWKHMESWGIAAQGGYWVPVLSVEVAAGGQDQFVRFNQLLANSGIQVRRKSP